MSRSTPETPASAQIEAMSVSALIEHVLANYHAKHRADLPDLIGLAQKVEHVHQDVPEVPHGLAAALERVAQDIDTHMRKEEAVLFPAMRQGAGAALLPPIAVMRGDHAHHAADIAELRSLTNGFSFPDDACGSWRRLVTGVESFCAELAEHMRIENDVLFPRFEIAGTSRCTCAHS